MYRMSHESDSGHIIILKNTNSALIGIIGYTIKTIWGIEVFFYVKCYVNSMV